MNMLKTNKGGHCRLNSGYSMIFHYENKSNGTVYWRCPKQGCGARALSEGLEGPDTPRKPHNHLRNLISPVKRQRKADMKATAAANRALPSRGLAADALQGLSDHELQQMPSQRSLQQSIAHQRKIKGAKDADLKPDKLVLPPELKATIRGDRFLLVDSRDAEPDKPVFLVFASADGCRLLRENHDWCADSTYYAAPKHFDNLFTINALVDGSSLPAVYAFLPNQRQETYERMLTAVFGTEDLRGVQPSTFITDLEVGLVNAMMKAFPGAENYFCLFHMAKAVWTNVQKKRIIPLYDIEEVKILLRCFTCLALLPINEVIDGFNDIVRALNQYVQDGVIHEQFVGDLKRFILYFRDTYIGHRVGPRYVRPRFALEAWSCFYRTLAGIARTNNGIEGFHNALNQLFPCAHLPLSQTLTRLQKEEELTRNLVVRQRAHPAENVRGRPNSNTVRERNLRELVIQYNDIPDEERPAKRLEYLKTVQLHLSPSAFRRMLELQVVGSTGEGSSQPEPSGSAVDNVAGRSSSQPLPSTSSQSSVASAHSSQHAPSSSSQGTAGGSDIALSLLYEHEGSDEEPDMPTYSSGKATTGSAFNKTPFSLFNFGV